MYSLLFEIFCGLVAEIIGQNITETERHHIS